MIDVVVVKTTNHKIKNKYIAFIFLSHSCSNAFSWTFKSSVSFVAIPRVTFHFLLRCALLCWIMFACTHFTIYSTTLDGLLYLCGKDQKHLQMNMKCEYFSRIFKWIPYNSAPPLFYIQQPQSVVSVHRHKNYFYMTDETLKLPFFTKMWAVICCVYVYVERDGEHVALVYCCDYILCICPWITIIYQMPCMK